MIVVGGVYREVCLEPEIDQVFGSGLRAALAISRATQNLKLITLSDAEGSSDIRKVANAFGFDTDIRPRPHEIIFQYDTPMSRPRIVSADTSYHASIPAESETALAFGMIDAIAEIRARRLVIDPQGQHDLSKGGKYSADRLAIVGNRMDIIALAEEAGDVATCAGRLRDRYEADVIVVKCGALGAMVVDSSGVSTIGAFPTQTVAPIGSGDVFSAVFTFYWAEQGATAVEAARLASKATAAWVSRGPFQVINASGEVVAPDIGTEEFLEAASIYLAGPFFTLGERWVVNLCRNALMDLGAKVHSPLHDIGLGLPEVVAPADISLLRKSDSVLALLDGCDPGTIFEVGYAIAEGIPVVGLSSNGNRCDLTMLLGSSVPIYDDLSSAIYNSVWVAHRKV